MIICCGTANCCKSWLQKSTTSVDTAGTANKSYFYKSCLAIIVNFSETDCTVENSIWFDIKAARI